MPSEQNSNSPLGALSQSERAILEFCAEGLSDREIAFQLRASRRAISAIRSQAAAKLAVRIASSHPFHIREVVLARSLDSVEL
jgi:DNA-binding NarL/FixJ family response regulator